MENELKIFFGLGILHKYSNNTDNLFFVNIFISEAEDFSYDDPVAISSRPKTGTRKTTTDTNIDDFGDFDDSLLPD